MYWLRAERERGVGGNTIRSMELNSIAIYFQVCGGQYNRKVLKSSGDTFTAGFRHY